MSGVIFDSNILSAVGLRVLLVVEDNGEGVNALNDKLTWGIYTSQATKWTPTDAEREDDNGASLSWIAKDFERSDDLGIPSNQSKTIGCQSFSLGAYSFVDVTHGGGNIQVERCAGHVKASAIPSPSEIGAHHAVRCNVVFERSKPSPPVRRAGESSTRRRLRLTRFSRAS